MTYTIVTNGPLILRLTYPNTLGPPPHLDHLHRLSLKRGVLADDIVYLSAMKIFRRNRPPLFPCLYLHHQSDVLFCMYVIWFERP